MESPERQTVQKALNDLKPYLEAYVEQRVPYGPIQRRYKRAPNRRDTQALLRTMLDKWHLVFAKELQPVVRSYVHELIDVRNRWAHEEPFSQDEAERAADTARMLAKAIGVNTPKLSKEKGSQRSPIKTKLRLSQRDVMRKVFSQFKPDHERVIAEYAAAEDRGDVERKSNSSSYSSEAYARALLNDGIKKGWLPIDD